MLLNIIWISFFFIGLLVGLVSLLCGDSSVMSRMFESLFSSAKLGFEISIGLVGLLCLWQGLLKVGEQSGIVGRIAHMSRGFFSVLFPSLPCGHPVFGTMLMNFSANLLGLDNAATPLGLQTMRELQSLNSQKDRASDAMIMYMCINASGLTIIPLTIIMYRMQLGSTNPTDIVLPLLLSTGASTLVAIIGVAIRQRISLLQRAFVLPVLCIVLLVGAGLWAAQGSTEAQIEHFTTLFGHTIVVLMAVGLLVSGAVARRNVYSDFIDGARSGFATAIKIIPYVVAILVAVGFFRASGAMDLMLQGVEYIVGCMGLDTKWVAALPTMLMKPLSGSGARGLMLDAMTTYGADSFAGHLVSMVQGATDTTFYILALYYGSIAVRNTRYTLGISLLADVVGMVTATLLCYFFF